MIFFFKHQGKESLSLYIGLPVIEEQLLVIVDGFGYQLDMGQVVGVKDVLMMNVVVD